MIVTGPIGREARDFVECGPAPARPAGDPDRRPAVVVVGPFDHRGRVARRPRPDGGVTVSVFAEPDPNGGPPGGPTPAGEFAGEPAQAFLAALRWAEHQCCRSVAGPAHGAAGSTDRDVAVIGAGIVNLVTAFYLTQAGYRLRIFDARPDPRRDLHWSSYGCSRAGDDARMFTLTEADDYHAKVPAEHFSVNGVFRRRVTAHGWNTLGRPLTEDEEAWVSDFERVPCWLARIYNEDIFSFARESHAAWRSLLRERWDLFQGVGYTPGILRLYTDAAQFDYSVSRHEALGAVRRVLAPDDVVRRHPGLATSDGIVGGLEVLGFTLNVHRFMAKLIDELEKAGASFCWDSPVESMERTSTGEVAGVRVGQELVSVSSYVVSTGAYGGPLLAGTRAAGQIHGVLGVWMRLPNLGPELRHSLKIAQRGHTAEDANVTLCADDRGRPMLVVGSGYGYVGGNPSDADPAELKKLYDAVEQTCRRFFPRAYKMAVEDGSLVASRRICVRPWTASNLGVFESMPTAKGGVALITGGHNTGGFAQAPSVAQAVLAALEGCRHRMHDLYRPDRLGIFLRPPDDGRRTIPLRADPSRVASVAR